MNIIRVSSKTNPNQLAGLITGSMQFSNDVYLQAVGAAAINQTVKAIAISRINLELMGGEVQCVPYFCEVNISGNERTAIRFKVTLRWEEHARMAGAA